MLPLLHAGSHTAWGVQVAYLAFPNPPTVGTCRSWLPQLSLAVGAGEACDGVGIQMLSVVQYEVVLRYGAGACAAWYTVWSIQYRTYMMFE